MIWRLIRWTSGIVLAVVVVLCLTAAWLLTTEGGARWLLTQASPLLPSALQIEEVNGTIIKGLNFRGVRWDDTVATASAADLDALLELMPLLRREVRIKTLNLRGVEVSISDAPAPDVGAETKPFSVDLPIALNIENASIEGARIATADTKFVIERVRLGAELSGSALRIHQFDLQSELADISLAGDAQLAGLYAADAHAAWELRLPDQPALSGILSFRGDTAGYEIQHDLDAPYEIGTSGTLARVDGRLSVDLANSWQLVRVEASDAPVVELRDGSLRLKGAIDDFVFEGATNIVSADVPRSAIETRGRFVGDRIDIESLSIVNDWGQLMANGEFVISPEATWRFNIELLDIDPAVIDARLTGKLRMAGNTTGRLVNQKPSLKLKIDDLSGDLNGYPVAGSSELSFANEELQIDSGFARIGDNRVDFDGSYGRALQVNARARFSDLSQFGLGAAGLLNADILMTSDLQTFQASGNLSGKDLGWKGYAVDTLEADFDLPAARDGAIVLQVASAEHGSIAAEIDGRFVDQQWSGIVKTLALGRESVGEWTLSEAANFSLSRSRFSLQKACLGSTSIAGVACIATDYDFSGPLQFEASVDTLLLAALPLNLPPGATLAGEVRAEIRGDFAGGRLNANAVVSINGLGLLATFEGDEVSAKFEKAGAKVSIADNKLVGDFEFRLDNGVDHAAGSVEIADLFDQRSALLGRASLEFNDLALLSFFVPDLANPVGKIFGNLDASGSLMAPEVAGEIGLRNGSVDIRRAGISVSEIELLLRQSRAGELALKGRAESGDGYLGITGKTSFATETGIRTEIRLDGENFTLIRLPDWQVSASPAIAVLFDESQTRVTGKLGIPEASITVKTVPETTEKPSPDAVVHRGDESSRRPQRLLTVDVTTNLGEQVFFSGFGLTTGLEGSVRITGDNRSPYQSFGRVVLREGRYQAYGQNLAIESGELVFNGPLNNPSLNVRATRTASDKTVAGIHLTGTPKQLKSEVYSDPVLGDAEALSYLLTGRPLSNANSAEGDMLNQAAFALGLTTAGSVASRIRNELGLETLGIQGGSENRQLFAGKRFGDRLFVEYAYGVVDNLGTLLLRYQLTRRLMVESRSGSVRNADIVYSVKRP